MASFVLLVPPPPELHVENRVEGARGRGGGAGGGAGRTRTNEPRPKGQMMRENLTEKRNTQSHIFNPTSSKMWIHMTD